ncbi:GntR family transcriptional regulator [Enterococcus saccharolyticus]|uniref:GntR family transcriptional regulator n=1 Tax=Enterococcus saccharolyticus TaxID=41997 RepID=UPI001E5BED07|nr:GntR family transcriptional regulator [Enterococcus saccharolyticus]MCD5002376.1 GntR family transcriptional regulator [Enterococcus saccharolyticus]
MSKYSLPLYQSIAKELIQEIESGTYRRGEFLPTEAKLCKKYHVSRVTVRQAIKILVDEGYVVKTQGSGTRVIFSQHLKILERSSKIIPFSKEMELIGKNSSSKIKTLELINSNKQLSKELELELHSPVFFYERILYGDDYPYCFEQGYMPVKYFPDFNLDVLLTSKMYYIETIRKIIVVYSHQIVQAILADDKLHKNLLVPLNSPLLDVTHITYNDHNRPIMKTSVIFDSNIYEANFIKYKS